MQTIKRAGNVCGMTSTNEFRSFNVIAICTDSKGNKYSAERVIRAFSREHATKLFSETYPNNAIKCILQK